MSGTDVSPLVLQLLMAMALMAIATVLAGIGSAHALRALPRLGGRAADQSGPTLAG
jgi:hypothetical protein